MRAFDLFQFLNLTLLKNGVPEDGLCSYNCTKLTYNQTFIPSTIQSDAAADDYNDIGAKVVGNQRLGMIVSYRRRFFRKVQTSVQNLTP